MTMRGTPVSEAEFGRLLQSFGQSAFRLETYDRYALDYEEADLDQFLAGSPDAPTDIGWWAPWLDWIAEMTAQGKQIGRVRICSEPPSDYQRWELWAAPWHARAGERIGYLPRSHAARIGLPASPDWWLLDDERLILMWFTEDGEIDRKLLVTDPEVVAQHREWRDLAVQHAIPAEEFTAA
jgi:hypothetical protein